MSNQIQRNCKSACKAQRGLCYYCYRCMGNKVTAEHLKARKDGGSNRKGNIAAACYDCNHGRHACPLRAALPTEHYRYLRLLERFSGFEAE